MSGALLLTAASEAFTWRRAAEGNSADENATADMDQVNNGATYSSSAKSQDLCLYIRTTTLNKAYVSHGLRMIRMPSAKFSLYLECEVFVSLVASMAPMAPLDF